jgi:uncharacterized RDD family membrane protein YckC
VSAVDQTDELHQDDAGPPRYVGFWVRVLASLVDTILMLLVLLPLAYALLGDAIVEKQGQLEGWANALFNYLLPLAIVMLFWFYRSATPGKIMLKAKIVDEDSLGKPQAWQWVVRYLGYYVSMLVLGMGFFWVGWDPRKQGFHDKLARTVVIYEG